MSTTEPAPIKRSFTDSLSKAAKAKSSADTWITVTCWLNVVVCVIAAPFTMGLSLLVILANAPIAALGCIATESMRQTELLKLQARMQAGQITLD